MIEKARLIYKNLIRMGPELNFELFRTKLLQRKFKSNERIINTPEGPLKEYVLTEPKYLRDLIIVSRKGFVVDSKDISYILDLINLAYEIYEETMIDYVEYIQTEIAGIYDLIVIVKNAEEVIYSLHDKQKLINIKEKINIKDLRPFGVAYAYGVPQAPHEFVTINLSPIIAPFGKTSRLKIVINYHGMDSEKGIIFLRNLKDMVNNLISTISQ